MDDKIADMPRLGQNFRAIGPVSARGGRQLREAMLFRTGDLSRLGDDGVGVLRLLGITSMVDLRSATERRHRPYAWLPLIDADPWGDPAAHSSASIQALMRRGDAPIEEVRAVMIALYAELPFSHARSIGEIARRIIAGRAPIVFGCAAGKDRTGVAAAMLLWQLGVPREAIIADYLVTNGAIDGLRKMVEQAFGWNVQTPHVEAVLTADSAYLDATFAAVERSCGGIDVYFEDILGIDAEGRRIIADRLTQDVAA